MLKVGLLCGALATMALTSSNIALAKNKAEAKVCDAKFIVELKDDIESINEDKAIKNQNILLKKIQNTVNSNSELVQHFSMLNNALVVTGNKSDIEALKNLPGVKSVTEEGLHIVDKEAMGGPISVELRSRDAGAGDEIDLTKNASAITMNKPENTNDGEGTLIAVLDNEFYLRNDYIDEKDGQLKPGFHHETFDPLTDDVKVRLTYNQMKDIVKQNKTFAQRKAGVLMHEEGSLYFNNKVPFYYDYAGDSHNGSDNGIPGDANDVPYGDYNVYSDVGLHGSHVASIAGGNARFLDDGTEIEGYKGIAPKCQLVCMKVFSDIYPSIVSEAIGNPKYSRFSEIGFLNALEDSMKLGVDAINVSIGSDLDDFDMNSITMRTLSKLTNEKNILSAISQGNGGKSSYAFAGAYGNWTRDVVETGVGGSFANNVDTMSIAAGQPVWTYYENLIKIGDQDIAYNDQIVNNEGSSSSYPKEHKLADLLEGNPDKEMEYVYVNGFGTTDNYQNKSVAGKIVVVNRGQIDFSQKYLNAYNKQAAALVIINNDPTANDFNFTCDFGDSKPEIPCVLVLFKDKPFFQEHQEGVLKIKQKISTVNKLANTISDFSTDGPRYDLDIKPEITTPGSNIKGAVTPQNKEEREPENVYHSYEYFNGTSMAAPNYEGAMAVLLSKLTKDMVEDGEITVDEKAELDAFKKTVNMRFMSTANPMTDYEANDENEKKSLTSPRMQGAGMADIKGAYNTDVYLEGIENGEGIGKSKILLRNNEDIANGDVKLKFRAHNESKQQRKYVATVTIMRPAIAYNNTILTDDYNLVSESIEDIKNIPGMPYYSPEFEKVVVGEGTASYKDAIKVTRDITYYENAEQYNAHDPQGLIKQGFYYVSSQITNSAEGIVWKEVPNLEYQSIKDVEIAKITGQEVVVNPSGVSQITINPYSLTKEQKDEIERLYPSGTYIEGYVELKASGDYEDLSIPFLGFYSLNDRHQENSFETAPVVEPFSFEKDPMEIYGSDLLNDITKQLIGKNKVNFESMMVTGYSEGADYLDLEPVLTNETNFGIMEGFHNVGYKPDLSEEKLIEDTANNLYVGATYGSNTLVVQQFVYRSVKDNYFTLTNKATGEVAYRSALEDMLFGQGTDGNYNLYKSHVDADYLSAGYVAHRAYAVIPLYDALTHEKLPSGDYELKFNYQLAATGNWVSKAYILHVDSDAPLVKTIEEFTKDGENMVRITFEEQKLAYAVVGNTVQDVKTTKDGKFCVEMTRAAFEESMETRTTEYSTNRLFIQGVDYARGVTNAVVHFNNIEQEGYRSYEILQGHGLGKNYDFKYSETDGLKVGMIDIENDEFNEVTIDEDLHYLVAKRTDAGGGVTNTSKIAPSSIVILSVIEVATISIIVISVVVAVKAVDKKKKMEEINDED